MIAPTFESLSTKHSKPNRITFVKVDVDRQQEVARRHGITAMPTFLVFKSGSVIETIRGANPPALTAAVEKAVKLAGAGASGSFSGTGRTLGPEPGSKSATGGAARPARGPVQGSSFDIANIIRVIVTFFGLYFVSLFTVSLIRDLGTFPTYLDGHPDHRLSPSCSVFHSSVSLMEPNLPYTARSFKSS